MSESTELSDILNDLLNIDDMIQSAYTDLSTAERNPEDNAPWYEYVDMIENEILSLKRTREGLVAKYCELTGQDEY